MISYLRNPLSDYSLLKFYKFQAQLRIRSFTSTKSLPNPLKSIQSLKCQCDTKFVQQLNKIQSQNPIITRYFSKFTNFRPGAKKFAKLTAIFTITACSASTIALYYAWNIIANEWFAENAARIVKIDYNEIYNAIEEILHEPTYDDGNYGPVFVRLAWHSAGTYDKITNTGGSSKATMRFEPEKSFEANRGLEHARDRLEIIKKKFPYISFGDLWTLAGVCAIQEMGGPIIHWRPGRKDGKPKDCPPDGRLPDGTNGNPQHPRDIFYRMGFTDQELTCLIGAHALGRCHKDRSGFEGPWTISPTSFSNEFYVQLLKDQWVEKSNWNGNKQFEDPTGHLMMMPADLSFKSDPVFKHWCEIYAKDEKRFFCDFAKVFKKLLELGVDFPENGKSYTFKRILK